MYFDLKSKYLVIKTVGTELTKWEKQFVTIFISYNHYLSIWQQWFFNTYLQRKLESPHIYSNRFYEYLCIFFIHRLIKNNVAKYQIQ